MVNIEKKLKNENENESKTFWEKLTDENIDQDENLYGEGIISCDEDNG